MVGAAGTVVAAAMLAAAIGPFGFLLLALLPIDIALAMTVRKRRLALRKEAIRRASGRERDTATVERAEEVPGMRGGQSARRVKVRLGRGGTAEALVYWTAAAPGLEGIAAWQDRDDVLLYFAEGPETPAELEVALNRETAQYKREPVLLTA
jgi:hypothetical protein